MKPKAAISSTLTQLGWTASKDSIGEQIFIQHLGENFAEFLFQCFPRSDHWYVPLLVRFGNQKFREIYATLTNRPKTENAAIKFEKVFRFDQIGQEELSHMSKEILDDFSDANIEGQIHKLADHKPEFPEDQLEYISALIWKRDLPTLYEERQLIEMPGSADYALKVQPRILDAALEMARAP